MRARTEPLTGYILGGVAALACKKNYDTVFIDETAILLDVISISAGMRGLQVLIAPDDYFGVVEARVVPIAKDKELPSMPEILHVTPGALWEKSQAEGEYRGDTLSTQGFIHCCSPGQLAGVFARYFHGQTGLVILRINSEMLMPPLRWERPPGSDETFLHVYGPLNLDAVFEVVPLEDVLER